VPGIDLVRRLRHDVDDVYDLLNDTNTDQARRVVQR